MKKSLKAILCILLSVLLLVPILGATAKEEVPLSVWVAADTHYRPLSALKPLTAYDDLPGNPLYRHANSKGMLTYEADAILDKLFSDFENASSNILLLPGDLSEDGFWAEHLAFAEKLRQLKARTGKQIFVIPGNHDIRTSDSQNRLNLADFLDIYADFGYNQAIAKHSGSGSYTAELENGYRLIAIDACIYREDGSNISPDLLAWIEEQAVAAKNDGKKLVGMVHHSVLDHFGIQSVTGNMLNISDARKNATKFADWGIKYMFTGHVHANDISMAVSDNGNRIYDIQTGSLLTYPNAYREVTFKTDAVKVETKYINNINMSLLPEGYSQAQLDMIQNNFYAYSFGYFKAGLNSVIYDISELTNKLARSLKIEQGTTAYNALSTAINTVGAALNLPLYDTANTPEVDSVEEIAAKAGLTIDTSDYANAFEIVGAIYAEHLAGDEDLTLTSPEVTLLGQSINAALVYAMSNIPADLANSLFTGIGLPIAGDSIRDNLYTQAVRQIYAKTAAKKILKEFVNPLLGSFISDSFAPGDLNETLEPYGATWDVTGKPAIISDTGYVMNIIFKLFGIVVNSVKVLWSV